MSKAMILSPSEEFSALLEAMLEMEDYTMLSLDWLSMQGTAEAFSFEKPDVLIVDIGFPLPHLRMDSRGLSCLNDLLDKQATEGVAIVTYSLVLDELADETARLRELGIPVVGNPYDLEDFAILIDNTLNSKRLLSAA